MVYIALVEKMDILLWAILQLVMRKSNHARSFELSASVEDDVQYSGFSAFAYPLSVSSAYLAQYSI